MLIFLYFQELLRLDARLRDILAIDRFQLDIAHPQHTPAPRVGSDVTSCDVITLSEDEGEEEEGLTLHLVCNFH